ncbi:hypothetical protein [Thalassobaculum sp.]
MDELITPRLRLRRVDGDLCFAEVGRATRTLQIGEEWCDSVYLELSRR